jgi:RNA-directed DNA polymerase
MEKLQAFAAKHQYGNWETMKGKHKAFLLNASDAEIALKYGAEMRGIAQYYALANNFSPALSRLRYLWIQSLLKTLACKHKMSVQQVATMLNRGEYLAVEHKGKNGTKRYYQLFRLKDVQREAIHESEVDKAPLTFKYTSGVELLRRMEAGTCEYCGKKDGYFEVHHIRGLADIKRGTEPWQKFMRARKRKTMVLCITCHDRLHAGTLPDLRHLLK